MYQRQPRDNEHRIYRLRDKETPGSGMLMHKLARLRAAGTKIVTTNGCFDLLHPGHIQFLQQTASLGEVLIVGLNSDTSVAQLKGGGRPIIDETGRATVLAALGTVDMVVIFDELTPCRFLDLVKPAVHCKASDYSVASLPEAAVVERNGGRIEILPLMAGYSTTEIVRRAAHSIVELRPYGGQ